MKLTIGKVQMPQQVDHHKVAFHNTLKKLSASIGHDYPWTDEPTLEQHNEQGDTTDVTLPALKVPMR